MVHRLVTATSAGILLSTATWADAAAPAASTPSIDAVDPVVGVEYVGKVATADFRGLGQHLQYWPLFGLSSGEHGQNTDDSRSVELTPNFNDFHHHACDPPRDNRTFSCDAGGDPPGVKTAGGYPSWAIFTLPDGRTGRSGTFYDGATIDNSNNSVQSLHVLDSTMVDGACLMLATDNTAGEHNPDTTLEVKLDTGNHNYIAGVPLDALTFNHMTDVYVFRLASLHNNDDIRIKFKCTSASGCRGAGLGGMAVSVRDTCADDDGDGITNWAEGCGANCKQAWIVAGATDSITAQCARGYAAGGGCFSANANNVNVFGSFRPSASEWKCSARNYEPAVSRLQARVLCEATSPGPGSTASIIVSPNGGTRCVDAICAAGTYVTGGGCDAASPNMYLDASFKVGTNRWRCCVKNNDTVSRAVTARGLCRSSPTSSTTWSSWVDVRAGGYASATATCPGKQVVVTGGCQTDDWTQRDQYHYRSYKAGINEWTCSTWNDNTTAFRTRAQAVCR